MRLYGDDDDDGDGNCDDDEHDDGDNDDSYTVEAGNCSYGDEPFAGARGNKYNKYKA